MIGPGKNCDVGERVGSGRTPLFDSSAEDVAETFYGAVDRSVNVRARHSYSDRSRRLETNRHGAGHRIAGTPVVARTKKDPSATELNGVARQCREYAVLSVRPRLRANLVVVADDVNAFHPQNESQAPGQRSVEDHRQITA